MERGDGTPIRGWSPIDVLPEILADVPDLVLAYTRDGRYLYLNRAAAEFLGVDPMHVVGSHWSDLGYSSQVMSPLTARIGAVASSGTPEYYRSTGSPERGSRVFDISLTPLWTEDGNVLAVLTIAHDISEFFATRRGD